MNVSRGLFRLWLVGSALFALSVSALFFGDIKREFEKASWSEHGIRLVPVDCGRARGVKETDYHENRDERDWALCWYELPKFRALYPEVRSLNDDQVSKKYYAEASIPLTPAKPWTLIGSAALFALIPPIVVFLLGYALLWALRGFA